jgi:hypothetical protein
MTTTFKLLWDKEVWVKTADPAEFSRIWNEISSDPLVPQSLIDYFKTEWIPVTEMWSGVSRQNRHIFEEGDTNMLIEVDVILFFTIYIVLKKPSRYHHVLKSRWLDGKHNCHLDHLIFTLVKSADPYYQFQHKRQEASLDRLNLEKSCKQDIEETAKTITQDSNEPQRAPNPATSTNNFHLLVQDVNILSNQLISEWAHQSVPSPTAIEAICCAKASLTAAVASVQGSRPLPQRELIMQNQHSWMETAERMGAQKAMKHPS